MYDKSIKVLSQALFEVDPANTLCKENDMFDEYDDLTQLAYKYWVDDPSKMLFLDCLPDAYEKLFEDSVLTIQQMGDILRACERLYK